MTTSAGPKRILIFSLAYYPKFVGGAEVAIKEITDRISPSEIEFDMVTAKLTRGVSSFEKIGNINIYRVGMGTLTDKILFPILGTFKVFGLMRMRAYDAFWPMMATYSSGSAYIVNILRKIVGKTPVPIVLTLQEGDSEEHIRRKWLGLIGVSWKLALKRTTHLTVISTYLSKKAREYGYTGPITLIPNGVDYSLFSSRTPEKEARIAQALDKKADDFFLITTGRLVLKNAVGDIIQALQYLPAHVRFISLGSGKLENELKQLAHTLKLSDRVCFLPYVSHTELPSYLHVSDIFVRPSLSEGLGNSFLEAMAAGLPVIATPVGGIPDFLKEGSTGLFCEVNNPKSIAQKIEKVMKDKESREYIISNAQKMVREEYDWRTISAQMKEVFRTVCAGK